MLTKIIKRDGREVNFSIEKIANAIFKAAQSMGGKDYEESLALANQVVVYLENRGIQKPTVEQVQDAVEKVLIENGHARTAKVYILYRAERSRVREMNTRLMKIYEGLTFKDAKDNDIKVIECNLRASRSFPFVSKVLKINFIELATKVMLGLPVEKPNKNLFELDYVGIKASQFSFNRLQKADPVLGVDMASTGEVGCIGTDTSCAVLKAMLSVGYRIPEKSVLLSTGNAKQKADTLEAARMLQKKGYKLYATGGSSHFLTENGVENTRVYWPSEEGKPQALDMLHRKEIDMVVNIPKNLTAGELDNGYKIRRAAIDLNVPLITNARLASAFINAFCTMTINDIAIKSWSEY